MDFPDFGLQLCFLIIFILILQLMYHSGRRFYAIQLFISQGGILFELLN